MVFTLCGLLTNGTWTRKFIFVHYDTYGRSPELEPYHGKAIGLDINDQHVPLPLLLLVHEFRVRGTNFYQHGPMPEVEVTTDWQDWMVDQHVVNMRDDGSFTLNRTLGPSPSAGQPSNEQTQVASGSTSGYHATAGPMAPIEEFKATSKMKKVPSSFFRKLGAKFKCSPDDTVTSTVTASCTA